MGDHAPRLPNNVIAALEDMIAIHTEMTPIVSRVADHARRSFDVAGAADVTDLVLKLAKLERLTRCARRGQYGGG